MRILQVRFKNLNSLIGEWSIDFTHPAFITDGIFAITGPTGAGKTTILDAVSLALYGRTPRLEKISKSTNEIMSRQTGECFAEVTFETQAGQFRCHWSQHRARRKPAGELQAPRHEIADAVSGKIQKTKILDVARKIEQVTGMDFDRFTRSMLLAQGDFAAFLQASPDERAPILEQITGTEIYSQISKKVHERHTDEQKKRDALRAELSGMRILTTQDEQQLSVSLAQKLQQDGTINQQITQKNQAVAWLENMLRLETALKQLDDQKNALQVRFDNFAPQQEKLERANQALELAAEYAALQSIRREQESDNRNLSESRALIPGRESLVKQSDEAMKKAVQQYEAHKNEQQKLSPVIRKVRELDLKICEKDALIKTTAESISENKKSFSILRARQKEISTALKTQRETLQALLKLLGETKADEALVEQLTGIQGRFETLQQLSEQLRTKTQEIVQTDNKLQEMKQYWQNRTQKLETEKHGLDNLLRLQKKSESAFQHVLEGKELADWRAQFTSLTVQNSRLEKVQEAVQSRAHLRQAIETLAERKATQGLEQSTLAKQLKAQSKVQASLEKEMHLLETQLVLLNKIEDFAAARHQLQDDEPCPLCGATEHPYAEGNIPVQDETRQQLDKVRTDLKTATNSVSDLKIKQARLAKELEQITSTEKAHAEKIETLDHLIEPLCAKLSIDDKNPDLNAKLTTLQNENNQFMQHAGKVMQTAETMEKELSRRRITIEQARETVTKIEREIHTCAQENASVQYLLARAKKETDELRRQQDQWLEQLQNTVSVFGVDPLSRDNLDLIEKQLIARRAQWILRQKEKSTLEQTIATLEIEGRHQNEQIKQSEETIDKQQKIHTSLLQELKTLQHERHALFTDKKPDDEEKRITLAIESAGKTVELANQQFHEATNMFGQLNARITDLKKSIAARDVTLQAMARTFQERLENSGFLNETNYKTACLPENERRALTQQHEKLVEEKNTLASISLEKTKLLQNERKKQITEDPLDVLNNELTVLIENQKALQQEIGAIGQQLKDNESQKKKQQQRLQTIAQQNKECARWELLHELIGSADGKKFRNFAQGLTFEIMTSHANRQLQKLTNRYLLIHDNQKPLALNVIDNYQAGEIRSTKNLSGGESFIVSLSLALGLSNMASKNMRVDSLFLDEGFGTLDEEALDIALETLSSLQQDGKLIGVISHVPALKERISTQISVMPQAGGKSLISGPGCGKTEAAD